MKIKPQSILASRQRILGSLSYLALRGALVTHQAAGYSALEGTV
jgi:hypothetical protein